MPLTVPHSTSAATNAGSMKSKNASENTEDSPKIEQYKENVTQMQELMHAFHHHTDELFPIPAELKGLTNKQLMAASQLTRLADRVTAGQPRNSQPVTTADDVKKQLAVIQESLSSCSNDLIQRIIGYCSERIESIQRSIPAGLTPAVPTPPKPAFPMDRTTIEQLRDYVEVKSSIEAFQANYLGTESSFSEEHKLGHYDPDDDGRLYIYTHGPELFQKALDIFNNTPEEFKPDILKRLTGNLSRCQAGVFEDINSTILHAEALKYHDILNDIVARQKAKMNALIGHFAALASLKTLNPLENDAHFASQLGQKALNNGLPVTPTQVHAGTDFPIPTEMEKNFLAIARARTSPAAILLELTTELVTPLYALAFDKTCTPPVPRDATTLTAVELESINQILSHMQKLTQDQSINMYHMLDDNGQFDIPTAYRNIYYRLSDCWLEQSGGYNGVTRDFIIIEKDTVQVFKDGPVVLMGSDGKTKTPDVKLLDTIVQKIRDKSLGHFTAVTANFDHDDLTPENVKKQSAPPDKPAPDTTASVITPDAFRALQMQACTKVESLSDIGAMGEFLNEKFIQDQAGLSEVDVALMMENLKDHVCRHPILKEKLITELKTASFSSIMIPEFLDDDQIASQYFQTMAGRLRSQIPINMLSRLVENAHFQATHLDKGVYDAIRYFDIRRQLIVSLIKKGKKDLALELMAGQEQFTEENCEILTALVRQKDIVTKGKIGDFMGYNIETLIVNKGKHLLFSAIAKQLEQKEFSAVIEQTMWPEITNEIFDSLIPKIYDTAAKGKKNNQIIPSLFREALIQGNYRMVKCLLQKEGPDLLLKDIEQYWDDILKTGEHRIFLLLTDNYHIPFPEDNTDQLGPMILNAITDPEIDWKKFKHYLSSQNVNYREDMNSPIFFDEETYITVNALERAVTFALKHGNIERLRSLVEFNPTQTINHDPYGEIKLIEILQPSLTSPKIDRVRFSAKKYEHQDTLNEVIKLLHNAKTTR